MLVPVLVYPKKCPVKTLVELRPLISVAVSTSQSKHNRLMRKRPREPRFPVTLEDPIERMSRPFPLGLVAKMTVSEVEDFVGACDAEDHVGTGAFSYGPPSNWRAILDAPRAPGLDDLGTQPLFSVVALAIPLPIAYLECEITLERLCNALSGALRVSICQRQATKPLLRSRWT